MKYLQSLRSNDKFSLKLTDIGVITPYRKQVGTRKIPLSSQLYNIKDKMAKLSLVSTGNISFLKYCFAECNVTTKITEDYPKRSEDFIIDPTTFVNRRSQGHSFYLGRHTMLRDSSNDGCSGD